MVTLFSGGCCFSVCLLVRGELSCPLFVTKAGPYVHQPSLALYGLGCAQQLWWLLSSPWASDSVVLKCEFWMDFRPDCRVLDSWAQGPYFFC